MPLPAPLDPKLGQVAVWRLDTRGEWRPGTLAWDPDRKRWDWDVGAGPEDAKSGDIKAYWTPPMFDAHTHLGDAFLRPERAKLPRNIAELVAPPDGYKHRRLAEASRADLLGPMRARAAQMLEHGTQAHADFREGGADGVRLLRDAEKDQVITGLALARPTAPFADRDEWFHEAETLLKKEADGIGVSGLADVPYALVEGAADLCRSYRKRLGLHLSEVRRESMEDALALDPDIIVHLVQATKKDLSELADAAALAVTCPTSNLFFDAKPPLAWLHALHRDVGLLMAFGSDNAMLGDGDLRDEARAAARLVPDADTDWLLRSLTWAPWQRLRLPVEGPLATGLLWGMDRKTPSKPPGELTLRQAGRLLQNPLHLAPALR